MPFISSYSSENIFSVGLMAGLGVMYMERTQVKTTFWGIEQGVLSKLFTLEKNLCPQ